MRIIEGSWTGLGWAGQGIMLKLVKLFLYEVSRLELYQLLECSLSIAAPVDSNYQGEIIKYQEETMRDIHQFHDSSDSAHSPVPSAICF